MRVIAFYSFFTVSNPELLKEKINLHFLFKDIKGSILVSKEGLNGTIAIPLNIEQKTIDYLMSLGVVKENIKMSNFTGQRIFNEFKVKLKKEIVTSNFGLKISEIKKNKFIDPQKWDKFTNDKNVYILDVRNDYEFKIGHFKNAINPKIETFKDFKNYIKKNKKKFQNKKVGIYCTGGIRCEKAGPLMEKYDIDTYQLKGGVLKYFEDTLANLWKGECFVFDNRVSLKMNLDKGSFDLCYACRMPIDELEKRSKNYIKGISCSNCIGKKTITQLNKYKTRQLQKSIG